YDGLRAVVGPATGRVVVACFGSNIARLHTLARVARDTGRYMGLLGRSLVNMAGAARAAGLWNARDHLINPAHLGYLPRNEVLAVATGSQGEPRTALHRLAAGQHPDVELEAGDQVVFSARAIPGNEEAIAGLVARLEQLGVTVVTAESAALPIHASGHPAAEELRAMYDWVRPTVAIPVHGEAEHMERHADIARACGVPRRLVGRNGDLFMIRPVAGVRRQAVATGRLGYDRGELVRVAD
ncbi:MAG: ribonuclease J, partial [Marinobacter sp.]|nr:ribonuclease J [Marinobacter sp.]